MKLQLFNTASRKIEEFVPLNPPHVGMYICGLTVYYYTHIGNLRAYTNSDILYRTLKYMGFDVRSVMNVTDVGHMTSDEDAGEDKFEVRARKEHKPPWEIAKFYEEYFFQSIERVNILKPDVICRATEHIADMIALVQRLEQQGFTYRTKVGVIFDTSKFADYGKFARLNLEGQQAGTRVEIDPERKAPWDFALWVTNQPNHIMQWDSPWGRGFPGWHIECSAMSMKYLGEELDIHTGGVDHITVHHPNEIAQSEVATGKQFVRYWMHSYFLSIDGQKMSKSLENLYTLDDVVNRGYSPLALRYFFLGSSYRKTQNFTWEALASAQNALVRLWQKSTEPPQPAEYPLNEELKAFEEAIGTDLNTSKALAVLWDVMNSKKPENQVAATLHVLDQILGLDLMNAASRLQELRTIQTTSTANEQKAMELARQRAELRQQKKFAEADALREKILGLGFIVEDTPQGFNLKPKGLEI
jgi:cysteinyl-tRNA synthetase